MPLNIINPEMLYKSHKNLKKEDVDSIKEWMNVQPHLPKISELRIILFLHSCYYSNEATKQTIDNFFTSRALCPEFFANRNFLNKELRTAMKLFNMTPMPKLTPEGNMIMYIRNINSDTAKFSFESAIKLFDMVVSLHLQENDLVEGHVIVFDLEGITVTHVLKCGIPSVKKFLYYLQEALPFRLKGMCFLNGPSFMDMILGLVTPFLKKEVKEMLQVFTVEDNDEVFNYIPRDCLPNEIGGTAGITNKILEKVYKKMKDASDFYLEEETLIADESKRLGKPRSSGELFGVEGTFKKLDLD